MRRRALSALLCGTFTGCLRLTSTQSETQTDTQTRTRSPELTTSETPGETTTPSETQTEAVGQDALSESWIGPEYMWSVFEGKDSFYAKTYTADGPQITGYEASTGEETLTSATLEDAYLGYVFADSWALDSEKLFVGARSDGGVDEEPVNARLYALNRSDGSVNFTYETPSDGKHGRIRHVRRIPEGPLLIQSDSGGMGDEQEPLLVALNPNDGTERWRVRSSGGFANGLAVFDDRVVVSTDGVRLYDLETGSLLRETGLGSFYGLAATDRGVVTTGETIAAYDIAEETVQWQATPPGGTVKNPLTVGSSRFYAATDTGWVFALDSTSGEQLWATRVRGAIDASATPPTLGPQFVWVSDDRGRVTLLNSADGAIVGEISPPDETDDARPVGVVDQFVFLGGSKSVVYRVST